MNYNLCSRVENDNLVASFSEEQEQTDSFPSTSSGDSQKYQLSPHTGSCLAKASNATTRTQGYSTTNLFEIPQQSSFISTDIATASSNFLFFL